MDKNRKNTKSAFTFAELMISLIVIAVLSAILYPTIAQFTPNSNKPLFKSAYKTFNEVMMEIVNANSGELGTYNAAGTFTAMTPKELCTAFCDKANVIHSVTTKDAQGNPTAYASNCADDCSNERFDKTRNTITTSNGMRWKFDAYQTNYRDPAPRNGTSGNGAPTLSNGAFKIIVDVNASNNNLSQQNVTADQTFNSKCDNTSKGGCGTFKYNNTNNAITGIYETIPNYTLNNDGKYIATESYNKQNLKNQDTFEIYIDKTGKIISMSPAAWANLEDNADTGN